MGPIGDILSSDLLRRALFEAMIVGALGGVIGVHLVLRRLSFTAMALTHATFPGVVLAAIIGANLLLGSAVFGVVVVALLWLVSRRTDLNASTATGVILAGGFASGVLLLSAQDGFSRDLTSFLVGSVLTVSTSDVVVTALAAIAIVGILMLLHGPLVFSGFDRIGAESAGLGVAAIDLGLLLLIEIALVVSIPTVGIILSVSLLVAPAATSRLWVDRIGASMVLAAGLGALAGAIGILISHTAGTAAGATIAVVAGAVFAISLVASPRHGIFAHRQPHATTPTTRSTTPTPAAAVAQRPVAQESERGGG